MVVEGSRLVTLQYLGDMDGREGDDQRNRKLFSLLVSFPHKAGTKKSGIMKGKALCLKNVMNCISCEQEARH